MSMFQYACPHCGRNNAIHSGNVGHVVRCMHCQGRVAWDVETPIRAPQLPPAPPKKIRWKEVGAGAFCLLLALSLLAQGSWQAFQACRSTSWPAADGVVISSRIRRPERDGDALADTTSAAEIRYSYQVDGVAYKNDTVRFGNVFMNDSFGKASATVKRHPPGPTTVYYDAHNPRESVLEPGLHIGNLLGPTGAGLLFTIVGCAVVRNGLRRR